MSGSPPKEQLAARQGLERFLDSPTTENLRQMETLLAEYQTQWITTRSGIAATTPAKRSETTLRPPRLDAADREVLAKLAQGWRGTTATVTRWAWFEDRELVRLEPDGDDEVVLLTDLGRAALT